MDCIVAIYRIQMRIKPKTYIIVFVQDRSIFYVMRAFKFSIENAKFQVNIRNAKRFCILNRKLEANRTY